MKHDEYPHTRATLLARTLLARIGELPVSEVHRTDARSHFEHAEIVSERWFRMLSRLRSVFADGARRFASPARVTWVGRSRDYTPPN